MAHSVPSPMCSYPSAERTLLFVEAEKWQGPSVVSSAEVPSLRNNAKAALARWNFLAISQGRVSFSPLGGSSRKDGRGAFFSTEMMINPSSLRLRTPACLAECKQSELHVDKKEAVQISTPHGNEELAVTGDEDVRVEAGTATPCPSLLSWFDKMSKNKLGSELVVEECLRGRRVQEQPFFSRRHFTMSMPAAALTWSLLPSMQQMDVSVPMAPRISPPNAKEGVVSMWRPLRAIFEGPALDLAPGEAWVEWDWLLHGPVAQAAVDEERVAFDEEKLLEQNRRIQALNNAPENFPGFIRKKFEVKVIATDNYVSTSTGLLYLDIDQGSGDLPKDGQEVVFHYTGYNESGRRVDSSYNQGQPARTRVGIKGMIPGFEEGIKSMKVGGKRRLVVPPELGPPTGPGTFFSAKQYEVFDVELLAVRDCQRRTIAFFSDVQCTDI